MAENAEIWPKMQRYGRKCRDMAENAEFMHKMQSLCTKCRVYAQNAVFMTKGTLVRKYWHVPAVRDLLKSAWLWRRGCARVFFLIISRHLWRNFFWSKIELFILAVELAF